VLEKRKIEEDYREAGVLEKRPRLADVLGGGGENQTNRNEESDTSVEGGSQRGGGGIFGGGSFSFGFGGD